MNGMIVYYSFSGSTKVYAEVLADLVNDPVFELREKSPRTGVLGMFFGAVEALMGTSAPLEVLPDIPAGKPVFICSPIWAGNLPPAVMTFIKNTDLRRRKVNVVLTFTNVLNRDAYQKKATGILRAQGCNPGFVQGFVCDRKLGPDRAIIRKHLKKLVLNVDEAY